MNMNGDRPRELPVFTAGLDAAAATLQGGDDFWPDVERLTAGDLTRHLDDALAGAAAPRVWLFVHEPGQSHLGVVAALTFARSLGERDQAAIVLDGDDRATVLSRWSGREGAEGWIDMVRYGTSVLTSGVALPFAGRTAYLLGVGSYAPTDISAEEVGDLLGRLRRQADDILIVCPLPAVGPWGGHTDISLLCVDRQVHSPARIAELGDELAAAGVEPTGMVGYGEPVVVPTGEAASEPTDEGIDAAVASLFETAADKAGGEVGGEAAVESLSEAAADEAVEEAGDEAAVESPPEAAEESVAAALADAAPPDPEDSFDVEAPTRRSTSGVFWIAATVSVVLIAVVAVYYFKYLRVGDDDFGDPAQVVASGPEAGAPAVPSEDEVALDGNADGGGVAQEQPAGTDSLAAASAPAGEVAADPAAVAQPPEEAPGETPAEAGPETATDREAAPATGVSTGAGADTEPAADPVEPFTVPVGRDGWALWVYSFPDGAGAARQLGVLERKGITAVVRIVEITDKGRWHRIYMGSFADKAAARTAVPALLERLRTDWAQPVRFYASTND